MNKLGLLYCFVLTFFLASCQQDAKAVKLNPDIFSDSIANKNVQLIDVRTPKEFHLGAIKNAINYDYNADVFAEQVALLDTTKAVFIYCRSGKRSSKSVAVFKDLGFKDVYELEGGILNWKVANE